MKILFGISCLFPSVIIYLVVLYFFAREAPPIKEYQFAEISPVELENRVGELIKKEGYVFNPNDTLFDNNDKIEECRFVILDKDSVEYYFETEYDEIKNLNKLNKSYIELGAIILNKPDQIGNDSYQFNTYEDSYNLHKIFERDFLDKIGKWEEIKWWQFWK
jgi:hypothetical protein